MPHRVRAVMAVAAAAILAHASAASAAPAQSEFVIGAMGGPQTNLYAADTAQAGITMRLASRSFVNLLLSPSYCSPPFGPCPETGIAFLSSDTKFDLQTAAALGMRLMSYGSPSPVSRPAGVTDAQWATFMGYRLTDESADGYALPDPILRAQIQALHLADTTKGIHINEIHTGVVQAWMALPQLERPDFYSAETYVPNSYEAYVTSYPPYAGHYPLVDDMDIASGTAPWWSLGYVDGSGYDFVDPNEVSLRAMAFLPVSYGARGIVWSQWGSIYEPISNVQIGNASYREGGTRMGALTTNAYWRLQRINHYLRDVVGPAIMKSDRRFTLHKRYSVAGDPEPWVPNISRYLAGPDKLFCKDAADIPEKVLVSIWEPRASSGEAPGTYFLLVMNTLLVPTTGTLQLRAATNLAVAAAPSVVDYQGGSNYAPVSATYAPAGSEQMTSFAISLQGAEARMYKVVPSGTNSDIAGLVSPVGGESWSGGSSQTITWKGISPTGLRLRLYTDAPRGSAPEGPYVTLTPGTINTVGDSYSTVVSVPGVSTARGRIEVAGTAANGAFVRTSHAGLIRVASAIALEGVAVSDIATTAGVAFATLNANASGSLGVMFAADADLHAKLWTGPGQAIATVPDHYGAIPGSSAAFGWYGLTPALCFGAGGTVHSAYFSLFHDARDDGEGNFYESQLLRYSRRTGTTWTRETIAYVGAAQGGAAIALDADGQPYVAYNSGSAGNYFLHVAHRNTDGTWTDLGIAGGRNPRDIGIGLDPDGNVWVTCVARNILQASIGGLEPGSFGIMMSVPGVTGPAAMHMASDGVPEVAYVKAAASGGSQTLYFQRVEWQPTGTYGSPPETIDNTTKTVDGLALSQQVPTTLVAYACNGVLRQGIRGAAGSWNVYDMDTQHDVGAPIGFGITPDNKRWISFWDRPANKLRLATYEDVPSGGGGEGGGEGEIMHAVSLHSRNPIALGGSLLFELDLRRAADVQVQLFDVAGRVVAQRPASRLAAGPARFDWRPGAVQPGMFFVRVRIDGRVALSKRVAIVR